MEEQRRTTIVEGARAVFHWLTLDRILALVAIAAGLVAVFFEVDLQKEARELQKDSTELQKESADLQKESTKIVESLSTRFVAEFPNDLKHLTDLMLEAKKDDQVRILVDLIGYGHYSAPSDFQKYLDSISTARQAGASIMILIYDDEAARADMCSQFTAEEYMCLAKRKPKETCPEPDGLEERQKQLEGYLDHYGQLLQGRCGYRGRLPGFEDFLSLLACTNEQFCENLITQVGAIKIRSIRKYSSSTSHNTRCDQVDPTALSQEPVFFWIVSDANGHHDKVMQLAYNNFSNTTNGTSFTSSDERLIKTFREHFDELWNHDDESTPRSDRCYSSNPLFPSATVPDSAKSASTLNSGNDLSSHARLKTGVKNIP